MAFKKFMKKGGRRYRKKATVKKAVSRARKAVFKKKVLSVIRGQAETKQAFTSVTSQAIRNQCSTVSDIITFIPSLGQGSADNQRVGDQVMGLNMSLKGYVRLPYDQTLNSAYNRRVALRVMIVKPKRYNSISDITTNATSWLPALLKKGGITIGFSGQINDLWAPINSDAITKYYDKIVYLKQDALVTAGGAAATQVTPVAYTSEGSLKFFSINHKLRKVLKFDANVDSGLLPTNFAAVMLVGLVYLNGDAPTGTTQAYMSFDTVFNYEDC